MPKFLIVAATKLEIQPILNHFNITVNGDEGLFSGEASNADISILITGVGMVNTAYYLGKHVNNQFTQVINVGICGAFDRNLKIGDVVNVISDSISEMGAENDNDFIKISDLNLGTNVFHNNDIDHVALKILKRVSGITVNTVHGNEESIQKIISLYDPAVESMEGAAFFRGCKEFNGNYIQLRAVSNYVEKRDKSKWNIALAIKNVNDVAINLINEIVRN